MKRLIIDGTSISKKIDGLTQYILNIVSNIEPNALNFSEIRMLLNKNNCPVNYLQKYRDNGIIIEYVTIPPIGPIREILFFLYLLKNKKNLDQYYIPSNQWPLGLKKGVYTIHDLIYEQYPEQLGRFKTLKKYYLRYIIKNGLNKSTKVIAVSKYTKNEILKYYPKIKFLEEKITVIYEGYEHLLTINRNINKNNFPFENYFLYVGSTRGHKNLKNLINAIYLIKESLLPSWGVVLIGNVSWMSKDLDNLIKKINNNRKIIHVMGWLSEEELSIIFSKSSAFIFPSLSEGFGIPVLEAFYYNIPLLCSNQTALPEIAGEGALYFDPKIPNDIGEKMIFFVNNRDYLTKDLINKGKERLKLFGWKIAAIKLSEYFI